MNTSSSIERAKLAAKCINDIKQVKQFTSKNLSKSLKLNGCPYSAFIFNILCNCKLIAKLYGSEYVFLSEEPIYFGTIQKELDRVADRQKQYTDNMLLKRSKTVDLIAEELKALPKVKSDDELIAEAIELLKLYGYKISKQVITYEEC